MLEQTQSKEWKRCLETWALCTVLYFPFCKNTAFWKNKNRKKNPCRRMFCLGQNGGLPLPYVFILTYFGIVSTFKGEKSVMEKIPWETDVKTTKNLCVSTPYLLVNQRTVELWVWYRDCLAYTCTHGLALVPVQPTESGGPCTTSSLLLLPGEKVNV